MAETKYWECEGSKEDRHALEEYIEVGEPCPECGRTYDAKKKKTGGGTFPLGKVLGGVALLGLLCVLGWFLTRPNPDPIDPVVEDPELPVEPIPATPTAPAQAADDYSWEAKRFTKGQRSLFSGVSSPSIENGIEAFKQKDYQKAISFFDQAVKRNPNEPEPLILFNNAKARQQGDALTLAVVVPVTGDVDSAKEMLRGVAMAQNEFNNSGGIGDRFLEIVVADDENNPEISKQVAQQLADDPSVLGVIGHNSSGSSAAGLEVYEAEGLAMISPTSSSTSLQGNAFFRTTPSDAAAAKKLAEYVSDNLNISKVVVFYNPGSNYSTSLKENFESQFKGTIVKSSELNNPGFNAKGEVTESVFINEAEAALLFPNKDYIEFAREIAIENQNIPVEKRLKLLGGDALFTGQTLIQGGANVEGLVLAVPWSRQSPTSQTFKQAGYDQWNGSVNWRTAMSYDATEAFINSFDNSNNTRASILEGLRQVRLTSDKTSGIDVQFTMQGERQGEPVLVEVAKGVQEKPRGTEFGYKLVE